MSAWDQSGEIARARDAWDQLRQLYAGRWVRTIGRLRDLANRPISG